MKMNHDQKRIIEEIFVSIDKNKDDLVVVEGKRDKAALQTLGFTNIIVLDRPLYSIVERVVDSGVKRVLLLTDLDSEGRGLYSRLRKDLADRGVVVDDSLRNLFFRAGVGHIEGLDSFLLK